MRRYHALDALRAAMMFLGIYLHAVAAYTPEAGWTWKQQELTRSLLWSISVIHVFRMPIFYAMAGFFTALLIARYGLRRAAWNRFMRIVVSPRVIALDKASTPHYLVLQGTVFNTRVQSL